MRLTLTGGQGPLSPILRRRLQGEHELVQLGGTWEPGLAIATGRLTDRADLRAAADGAEILVCDLAGALLELEAQGTPEPDLGEALESVVSELLECAAAVGARRALVLGNGRATSARLDAEDPPLDADDLRHWPRLAALRRGMDRALRQGADRAVVLAPSVLLGPDLLDSALLRRVALLRAGLAPPSAVLRLSLADTRDVGGAAVAALTRGRPGVVYEVGSRPFWLLTLDRAVPFAGPPQDRPPGNPDDLPVGVAWERARTGPARRDLGWWTRRAGRTLADTCAALDERDARSRVS